MDLAIDITRNTTLILHFIGVASLLGGFLTQMKSLKISTATVVPAMVHGAWTMLLTGLALVAVAEYRVANGADFEVNHAKVGIKLVVLLVILVLVLRNRKKPGVSSGIVGAIGALSITNIILAVVL